MQTQIGNPSVVAEIVNTSKQIGLIQIRGDINQIRMNLDRLQTVPDFNTKSSLFNDTVKLISQFDVAEEVVLYSVLRNLGFSIVADSAVEQTINIEKVLYEVDQKYGNGINESYTAFNDDIERLKLVFETHVKLLESPEILPILENNLSNENVENLNTWFQRIKSVAPTRPHPGGPHSTAGKLLTGPVLSFVDRFRDLAKDFSSKISNMANQIGTRTSIIAEPSVNTSKQNSLVQIRGDINQIRLNLDRLKTIPDFNTKSSLFNDTVKLISQFDVAEEVVLYSVLRNLGFSIVADSAVEQTINVEKVLYEVDQKYGNGINDSFTAFNDDIERLKLVFETHVKLLESPEILPILENNLSNENVENLNTWFQRIKSVAPTKPHPGGFHSATGKLLTGPVLSFVDRFREFAKDFSSKLSTKVSNIASQIGTRSSVPTGPSHNIAKQIGLIHIRADINEIRSNLDRLQSTPDVNGESSLFNDTVKLISQFDVAEEVVLYSVLRNLGFSIVADSAVEQTINVEKVLYEVDQKYGKGINDPLSFNEDISRLKLVFETHVKLLESPEILPILENNLSNENIENLNTWFQRIKAVAPTKPHPGGPHSAAGKLLTGPVLSFVDRFREFAKDFSSKLSTQVSNVASQTSRMTNQVSNQISAQVSNVASQTSKMTDQVSNQISNVASQIGTIPSVVTGSTGNKLGGLIQIRADINQIRLNLDHLSTFPDVNTKMILFNDTIKLMSQFNVAEEVVLYASLRNLGFKVVADSAVEQTVNVEKVLYELDQKYGNGITDFTSFNDDVSKLKVVFENHVKLLESPEILPILENNLSNQYVESLDTWFQRIKTVAPTRPHPSGFHSTAGKLLTGPVLSFVDRFRDLSKQFSKTP